MSTFDLSPAVLRQHLTFTHNSLPFVKDMIFRSEGVPGSGDYAEGLGFGCFKEVLPETIENADFLVPHIYISRYDNYTAYEDDAEPIQLNSIKAACNHSAGFGKGRRQRV